MIAFIVAVAIFFSGGYGDSTFNVTDYYVGQLYPADVVYFTLEFYESGTPVDHEIRVYDIKIPYMNEVFAGGLSANPPNLVGVFGQDDTLYGNGWFVLQSFVLINDFDPIFGQPSPHLMIFEIYSDGGLNATKYVFCLPQ